MNRSFKIITVAAFLIALTTSAFAKTQDPLDKWLDKYETFIEKVEDAAKNKQTSKAEGFQKEKEKMFKEKDKIQGEEGNFTFKQGLRYAELNSRYGIAIGAMGATKGLKKAAGAVDEFLEENTDSKKNSSNSKSKKA